MKAGQIYLFVPTNTEFEIAKVTEKNISWYVGFTYKSGTGKNTLRMAHTSVKRFQKAIDAGTYVLKS